MFAVTGYNMRPSSADPSNIAKTYQRIVEAFKFAYGQRSALGDEDFVDVAEVTDCMQFTIF